MPRRPSSALPKFPRRIGLVTSPQGAALQDFLVTAKQMGWPVTIELAPAIVRGRRAPRLAALGLLNPARSRRNRGHQGRLPGGALGLTRGRCPGGCRIAHPRGQRRGPRDRLYHSGLCRRRSGGDAYGGCPPGHRPEGGAYGFAAPAPAFGGGSDGSGGKQAPAPGQSGAAFALARPCTSCCNRGRIWTM